MAEIAAMRPGSQETETRQTEASVSRSGLLPTPILLVDSDIRWRGQRFARIAVPAGGGPFGVNAKTRRRN